MIGRFTPSLVFRRSTALFHAPACLELCDFLSVPHGSESILLGFGAVMMLGGRQSGETISSALPEPILNVDMLIVTFKFLPCLTAHENTLLLYYRHFSENAHDFLKSLQFVHDLEGGFLENGIAFWGKV